MISEASDTGIAILVTAWRTIFALTSKYFLLKTSELWLKLSAKNLLVPRFSRLWYFATYKYEGHNCGRPFGFRKTSYNTRFERNGSLIVQTCFRASETVTVSQWYQVHIAAYDLCIAELKQLIWDVLTIYHYQVSVYDGQSAPKFGGLLGCCEELTPFS